MPLVFLLGRFFFVPTAFHSCCLSTVNRKMPMWPAFPSFEDLARSKPWALSVLWLQAPSGSVTRSNDVRKCWIPFRVCISGSNSLINARTQVVLAELVACVCVFDAHGQCFQFCAVLGRVLGKWPSELKRGIFGDYLLNKKPMSNSSFDTFWPQLNTPAFWFENSIFQTFSFLKDCVYGRCEMNRGRSESWKFSSFENCSW